MSKNHYTVEIWKTRLKEVGITFAVLFATSTSAFGQHSVNPADNALKGSGRVNPSTLAMEIDVPIASYSGRGINVPIKLSYSSKLWEIPYTGNQITQLMGCIASGFPRYSDKSASGWTTSLDVPYIEFPTPEQVYDNNGFPVKVAPICGDESTSFFYGKRVIVHLPGGETHELRADDTIRALSNPGGVYDSTKFNGTFYAVDGSNIRYVHDTATGTKRLEMSDGSYYSFGTPVTFTDRNGNSTSYTPPAGGNPGYWTDTLGRQLEVPFLPVVPTAAGVQEYEIPGLGGATSVMYKFHWKKLKDTTEAASALTDYSDPLHYAGDKWYNGTAWVERTYALFDSSLTQYTLSTGSEFNPVVLSEIELPTGESYRFTYDVFGRIEQIFYPTGGKEVFNYGVVPTLTSIDDALDLTGQANFGVVNRKLYQDANESENYEWVYGAGYADPAGYVVSVTNPDGTTSERFLHRGFGSCGNCTQGEFGYDNGLAGMEYESRSYDNNNTLVSRTFTHWELTNLAVTFDGSGTFHNNAGWHPRVTYQESISYDPAGNGNAVSSIVKNEYQGNLSNRDTPLLLSKTTQYAFAGLTSAPMPSPGATPSASPTPIPTPSPSTTAVKIAEYLHLINDSTYSGVKSNYTNQNMIGLVTESVIKDGSGNVVSKTINVFDESGKSPGYRGNPTTLKIWDSTKGAYTSSGAYISTTAKFDSYGNQYEATDAKGCTTETEFDSTHHAFPIEVTSCTPSDGTYGSNSAFVTTATFDPTTGLPLTTTNANGLITAIEYDPDTLRPLNTKTYHTSVSGGNQVGSTVETEYHDEPGNYWVKNRSQIDTGIWAESITYFDGLGRAWKSEEINSKGNIFVEKEFDAEGRVKRVSNPFRSGETKVWTTNTYDEASRLIEVELQDGSTIMTDYGVSTSAPIGITKQITDQAGKKRKGITDVLGRMMRVIEDPSGTPLNTDYVFDTLGNLRKTIQGDQNRFFMHDSLGRLLFAKQPEQDANSNFLTTDPITSNTAWSVKYEYDDNGNITRTTDARGVYIEGTYDAFNRLKTRNYSDSTPDVSFYYDGYGLGGIPNYSKGKTTKVTSSLSETKYTTFDILGRLLTHQQITDSQTYSTEYEYNLSGGLIKETYPSGREINHEIDENGDLERVWGDNSGTISTYANGFNYNVSGAIEKMRLGNGRWETALYNSRQQITQIGLGMGSSTPNLLKLEFGYGDNTQNNGNLRTQTITVPTVGGTSGFAATQTYAYDDLNRLLSATETINSSQTWKQTFTMDRYGNRRYDAGNTTTLGGCAEAVCNPTVSTSTNRFTSGGWDYDEAGNVIEDATGYQFGYDAENHQIEVKNEFDATVGEYFYDGEGRRVKKIAGAETTVFVYNASGQLVAEYSTQTAQSPQTSYLTTDHLGSTRLVTDQLGAVKDRKDYGAFGDETATAARVSALGYTTAEPTRKGYTGYEKDAESSLEFAQARYYSTTHGRYTSVDPLTASASVRNPQTFNRYTYVLNSPYKFTDPLGLLPSSSTGGCNFKCRVNAAIDGKANLSDSDRELALFHIRNGTALGYAFLDAANAALSRPASRSASQQGALTPATPTSDAGSENGSNEGYLTYIGDFMRDGRDNTNGLFKFAFIQSDSAKAFMEAVLAIEKEIGRKLLFNEMFRSTEMQGEYYDDYQKKLKEWNDCYILCGNAPALADPPGESTHELGASFDISMSQYTQEQQTIIISKFEGAGFIQNVHSENWHFTQTRAAGWRLSDQSVLKSHIRKAQESYRKQLYKAYQ